MSSLDHTTPILPEGTFNQEAINCPGSVEFRLIFVRVLLRETPTSPEQLTLPTEELHSPHDPQRGKSPSSGYYQKVLLQMGETVFSWSAQKALEVRSSPGCGEVMGVEWEQSCREPALGLSSPRYLATHREVEADPVELQQVPVELPL